MDALTARDSDQPIFRRARQFGRWLKNNFPQKDDYEDADLPKMWWLDGEGLDYRLPWG
jgi:GrpB-like predicted nucleotidyltransferase (UPF0157 family)